MNLFIIKKNDITNLYMRLIYFILFYLQLVNFSFERWNGVICHEPSEQECKDVLSNNDIYM